MNGPDISTNTHVEIDRSLHPMNYFASLGIFMHQGCRTQREQNHWYYRSIQCSAKLDYVEARLFRSK